MGWQMTLLTNFRLPWKYLWRTNILAYVATALVAEKKFYNCDTCGLYYKSFTIVIYNHNDNGLYYKTTIIANLAWPRSVNFDHKVRCKLKHTQMIVNYNPKNF